MRRKWSATERAALITVVGIVLVTVLSFILTRHQAAAVPTQGTASPATGPTTFKAPFPLDSQFFPSGWMGDGKHGTKQLSLTDMPVDIGGEQKFALKVEYHRGREGWAGVYWQHPDKNWGEQPGLNLTGVRKITFMARGEKGGEIVEFKSGGIGGKFPDTSWCPSESKLCQRPGIYTRSTLTGKISITSSEPWHGPRLRRRMVSSFSTSRICSFGKTGSAW